MALACVVPISGCEPKPKEDAEITAIREIEEIDEEEPGVGFFELGGDITLEVILDPAEPKAGEPTRIRATFASAYGRPMSQLSVRLVPDSGEPTDWQPLTMTKGMVYNEETDEIVEAADLQQQSPAMEYGASIYEGTIEFPAGESKVEFKDSEGTPMNFSWTVSAS